VRALYIAGWSYVAIAGALLYRSAQPAPEPAPVGFEPRGGEPSPPAATGSWFETVRAHCNPVEVEVTIASSPPPSDWESQAYAAACYALAGKIERAAERIDALRASERAGAANIVFNVGHPVADAGDDDAAGPIMQLVIRYTPDNYMALYHAGIAQARVGELDLARANLLRFLELYRASDGWTQSARSTLAELGVEDPGR
jgi:tetratricopeptide (TPR) repeat protein